MKVGIISMQRVNNYGSFLQAYSLKKNIEAKGHECEFIDIKPGDKIVEEKKKQDNYLLCYIVLKDKSSGNKAGAFLLVIFTTVKRPIILPF